MSGGPDFTGIWGTSGSNVYAVDRNGMVQHFDGAAWAAAGSISNSQAPLFPMSALWGRSASDLFLVGGPLGAGLHFDGSTWSPFAFGGLAIWGDSHTVMAVGSGTVGEAVVQRFAGRVENLDGGACASPIPIYCGSPTPYFGDTVGAQARVASWACATRPTSGPEVYYRFESPISGSITARLSPHAGDLDLILVGADAMSRCDPATCIAASQNDGTAEETVTTTVKQGATYYFAVDGYGGATSGYTLTLDCTKQ
jgi:hypothetical protein